jgi:hypothetical protein
MKLRIEFDFDSCFCFLICGGHELRLEIESVQEHGEQWFRRKCARFRRYARSQKRRVQEMGKCVSVKGQAVSKRFRAAIDSAAKNAAASTTTTNAKSSAKTCAQGKNNVQRAGSR